MKTKEIESFEKSYERATIGVLSKKYPTLLLILGQQMAGTPVVYKEEILSVRCSKVLADKLKRKHPRKYSTAIRVLIQMYVDGKIHLEVNDALLPGSSNP